MKNQMLSHVKILIVLMLLALFVAHRLLAKLGSQENSYENGFHKFPGINIKEF